LEREHAKAKREGEADNRGATQISLKRIRPRACACGSVRGASSRWTLKRSRKAADCACHRRGFCFTLERADRRQRRQAVPDDAARAGAGAAYLAPTMSCQVALLQGRRSKTVCRCAGKSVRLAICDGNDAVFIARAPARRGVCFRTASDSRLPDLRAFCTRSAASCCRGLSDVLNSRGPRGDGSRAD